MQNPVIHDILGLLRGSGEGITEHAIHRALCDHEAFINIGNGNQLALFRKHFLVMNALYQLQIELWEQTRLILSISPLCIQLQIAADADTSGPLTSAQTVSDYYLDWDNYRQTTETDVSRLIDSFWQHYHRQDKRRQAMRQLELDADATPAEIESRYRRLVSIHHPDKGGDREAFINIRSAYEQLR